MVSSNRCIDSTLDIDLRTQAFKIARDNMEHLLGFENVGITVEFGTSEENPDIEWELTIESFKEPATQDPWLRATSKASFTAASGEREDIELEHWLTDLSEDEAEKLDEQKLLEEEFMEENKEKSEEEDPDPEEEEEEEEKEKKPPLTPEEIAKLKQDYINGLVSPDQVIEYHTNGQISTAVLFDILFSKK